MEEEPTVTAFADAGQEQKAEKPVQRFSEGHSEFTSFGKGSEASSTKQFSLQNIYQIRDNTGQQIKKLKWKPLKTRAKLCSTLMRPKESSGPTGGRVLQNTSGSELKPPEAREES